MNPLSVFNTVEHWMQNFFVKADKAVKIFELIEKDAPSTAPALKDFWQKSLSLAAATATTISDRGVDMKADTVEFQAIKDWLVSLKVVAVKIEEDVKEAKVVEATAPSAIGVPPISASTASTIPVK